MPDDPKHAAQLFWCQTNLKLNYFINIFMIIFYLIPITFNEVLMNVISVKSRVATDGCEVSQPSAPRVSVLMA